MDIVSLIKDFGFPVACVIALGYYSFQTQKQQRLDSISREERLYSQFDKFSDSMKNFNETLVKIDKRLEFLESKNGGKENDTWRV